jgi:hypothetical protein
MHFVHHFSGSFVRVEASSVYTKFYINIQLGHDHVSTYDYISLTVFFVLIHYSVNNMT